ncbi:MULTISPECIES: hypothetical protein [unclassified Mesorhizobium]|uniref:hypothetical protein n=1 Tax=unclassified Mesorhizobium TaxID=325217 RepID=UPI000F74DD42|nr:MULTISPECIES: hypothetical protein [unclassified Mesorhizobium]AZO09502.1 hypothetical protein EJ074_10465 [Mesorhizobium sp. M3A.F.Ca.ET.080.04.2.1]RWB66922.1 MAG: hypothetical protein EOQ49_27005 [Mesorhizobium sp.]RWB87622.1 MAG: hypothetical protein EOQ52_15560 [Mesorhizobium sp.]RWE38097.1 MAG: hypothetical protein EOS77_00385 [Mesorhizobium sp.]RWF23039.1 MAG: hypothetical protein EOS64_12920 [Mesorhizobium sp.]
MPARRKVDPNEKLVAEWPLSPAATLGSSVRARGIFLEMRTRLPTALKKLLHIESRVLTLRLPEGSDADVEAASAIISEAMTGIEDLPVIPREVEDILTISTSERQRWLKDGRLRSAGTRTVKLRGRARKITFHVFDPRQIEDVLDRDLVTVWREEDAATATENRRRAAAKAVLRRAQKSRRVAVDLSNSDDDASHSKLRGWEDFESEGLLR